MRNKKTKIGVAILASLLCFAFVRYGCGIVLTWPYKKSNDKDWTFKLYVSNQSYMKPLVDLTVYMDNELILKGNYFVWGQHKRHEQTLRLSQGKHTLYAFSNTARMNVSREFEVVNTKLHATLIYFYSRKGDMANKAVLSFEIYDHEIGFL